MMTERRGGRPVRGRSVAGGVPDVQVLGAVDVRERLQRPQRVPALVGRRFRLAEDVLGPPIDPAEQLRTPPAHPDEVISPVKGRPQHDAAGIFGQEVERPAQEVGGDPRAVRADHHDPRGSLAQGITDGAGHAIAEVSRTLRAVRDALAEAGPNRRLAPAVEPDLDVDSATRAESRRRRQGVGGQLPVEIGRTGRAEPTDQAGLDLPGLGKPREDDQPRGAGRRGWESPRRLPACRAGASVRHGHRRWSAQWAPACEGFEVEITKMRAMF